MPAALAPERRTMTLEGGKRSTEVALDPMGRHRLRGNIDANAVTRASDDAAPQFKGHAAVFESRTWIGSRQWGFHESIDRGAFSKTIAEADVRMLHNHNPDLLLARTTNGSLRLSEDAVGLAVDAEFEPVSYARDIAVLLERRTITQMSFAFEPIAYRWEEMADGTDHYIHTEVRLWDVSTVTYPAYEDTDAGLRALALDLMCRSSGIDASEQRKLLRALRDGDDDTLTKIVSGLTRSKSDEPPASTTAPSDSPPAETTGATQANPLALRMLRTRMASLEDPR